jgi:hypothetical protein
MTDIFPSAERETGENKEVANDSFLSQSDAKAAQLNSRYHPPAITASQAGNRPEGGAAPCQTKKNSAMYAAR